MRTTMIKGIGTDIVKVSRMNFDIAKRILSESEFAKYQSFSSDARKQEFLAGRFAIKEAISKALSHIDFELSFNELEIKNNEFGQPYLICHKLNHYVFSLSISHESDYAIGFCIIEDANL